MTLAQQIADKLSEYDFVIAIDTSGSMSEPNKAGSSVTRWEAVQETAMTFIRDVQQIDQDGLGLVLFGGQNVKSFNGVTADKAREVFAGTNPRGSTPLAEALEACFALAGKSDKKDMIVVFTDGVPDDREAAAKRIIQQANSQANDDDCTVLFVQVGDDAAATRFLQSLDGDLTGAKFDIVDTKTAAEADAFNSTAELIVAAIEG